MQEKYVLPLQKILWSGRMKKKEKREKREIFLGKFREIFYFSEGDGKYDEERKGAGHSDAFV